MRVVIFKRHQASQYLLLFFLASLSVFMLLPLIWLVSSSFKGPGEIFQVPFHLLPKKMMLDNYFTAWRRVKLQSAFLSSSIATSLFLVFHLSLCTTSGYVFAKFRFRRRNILFTFVIATMMIPQEVTYFAVFDTVRWMKSINTYWGLALPFLYSGFGVFLMRQFALSLPDEFIESAKIEGCGNFAIFFRIVLPNLKQGVFALGILAFSFMWEEYAWARICAASEKVRTLSIALTFLLKDISGNSSIPALLAGSVIAMVPVLVIFIIFQKQFIQSVMSTGIK